MSEQAQATVKEIETSDLKAKVLDSARTCHFEFGGVDQAEVVRPEIVAIASQVCDVMEGKDDPKVWEMDGPTQSGKTALLRSLQNVFQTAGMGTVYMEILSQSKKDLGQFLAKEVRRSPSAVQIVLLDEVSRDTARVAELVLKNPDKTFVVCDSYSRGEDESEMTSRWAAFNESIGKPDTVVHHRGAFADEATIDRYCDQVLPKTTLSGNQRLAARAAIQNLSLGNLSLANKIYDRLKWEPDKILRNAEVWRQAIINRVLHKYDGQQLFSTPDGVDSSVLNVNLKPILPELTSHDFPTFQERTQKLTIPFR